MRGIIALILFSLGCYGYAQLNVRDFGAKVWKCFRDVKVVREMGSHWIVKQLQPP